MKKQIYKIVAFFYVLVIPFYGTFDIPIKAFIIFPLVIFFIFNDFSFPNYIFANQIHKYFLLFFFSAFISSLFSEDLQLGFNQLVQFSLYYVFYLNMLKIIHITGNYIVFVAFGISVLISILIGYLQFIGFEQFYIYSVDNLSPNTMMYLDSLESMRAWGPFGNSLTFSNFLGVAGIIISTWLVGFRTKKHIFYSIIFFTFVFFGLIISGGRTASISFLGCYLFAFYYINKSQKKFFILFFILVVSMAVAYSDVLLNSQLFARFLDSKKDFKSGRLDNWVKGIEVFFGRPLFGCGPGNLNTALQHLSTSNDINEKVRVFIGGHVESVYVTILATYGLIGSFFFVKMIISTLNLLKRKTSVIYEPFRVSLLSGWILMLINMITNPAMIVDIRLGLIFMLLLVLPISCKYDRIFNYSKTSEC